MQEVADTEIVALSVIDGMQQSAAMSFAYFRLLSSVAEIAIITPKRLPLSHLPGQMKIR